MNMTTFLIYCNLSTFVLTALTIVHTWRLKRLRSIQWLTALSLTFLIGSFCLVNVYVTQDFEVKVFFMKLRVLGMAFLPPCMLYFLSAVFHRWEWLHKKWVRRAILAPSVLNILLLAHPTTREFLLTNFQPVSYLGVDSVKFDLGKWYTPFYLWGMVLMLACYAVSIVAFIKSTGFRRRQVLILNIGMTASVLQSAFARGYLNVLELEQVFAETFILLGTVAGVMYAVIHHRLLSIVPLAMEKIFRQFPDPVVVLDDEQRVMGVSESGVKFFNLPDDYLGKDFATLLPTVPLKAGELDIRGHHFHVALEKLGQDSEAASGTVVFFRDINSQKTVEFELHEGMEFRTRLLALMAHDLSGFVDTQHMIAQAMQKSVAQENIQHLDHLKSLSMASQGLISNVMSWMKNESTKFDPVKTSFEWKTLIQDVLEHLQGRLVMKGIEVTFVSPAAPVIALGDSEMMASVLRNLLFNAIRASSHDKKIHLTLTQVNDQVEVSIRDEGHGISAEELKRILGATEVFSTLGVSKTHGSGIGLMLARSFISLHRGTFSMTSVLGVGTQVSFSVPL